MSKNYPYFNQKILCFLFLILTILPPINICNAQPYYSSTTTFFAVNIKTNDDLRIGLIKKCVEYVNKNIKEEGIYRKSGVKTNIETHFLNYEKLYEEKKTQDFNRYLKKNDVSVHEVTCLLKDSLGKLKFPLMGNVYLISLVNLGNMIKKKDTSAGEDDILSEMKKLLNYYCNKLQKSLLKEIMVHLNAVASNQGSNKMNSESLAMAFIPNFLGDDYFLYLKERINKKEKKKDPLIYLFSFMIENVETIFDNENEIGLNMDEDENSDTEEILDDEEKTYDNEDDTLENHSEQKISRQNAFRRPRRGVGTNSNNDSVEIRRNQRRADVSDSRRHGGLQNFKHSAKQSSSSTLKSSPRRPRSLGLPRSQEQKGSKYILNKRRNSV